MYVIINSIDGKIKIKNFVKKIMDKIIEIK